MTRIQQPISFLCQLRWRVQSPTYSIKGCPIKNSHRVCIFSSSLKRNHVRDRPLFFSMVTCRCLPGAGDGNIILLPEGVVSSSSTSGGRKFPAVASCPYRILRARNARYDDFFFCCWYSTVLCLRGGLGKKKKETNNFHKRIARQFSCNRRHVETCRPSRWNRLCAGVIRWKGCRRSPWSRSFQDLLAFSFRYAVTCLQGRNRQWNVIVKARPNKSPQKKDKCVFSSPCRATFD